MVAENVTQRFISHYDIIGNMLTMMYMFIYHQGETLAMKLRRRHIGNESYRWGVRDIKLCYKWYNRQNIFGNWTR